MMEIRDIFINISLSLGLWSAVFLSISLFLHVLGLHSEAGSLTRFAVVLIFCGSVLFIAVQIADLLKK